MSWAPQVQTSFGAQQKRGYDTRCWGWDFTPGDQVWGVCTPRHKKGVSPKCTGHSTGYEVVDSLLGLKYYTKFTSASKKSMCSKTGRLAGKKGRYIRLFLL
ncbi:hypothetical protein COCON_G00032940 [Conger conger]|uniref:Uncharacterized protein n=1 Tax=Conger conger TaxID=82655 RepID=A0A9Q1I6H9_CONCO|nr:hypothetical protein COCON_G00032940 [Conger conger]